MTWPRRTRHATCKHSNQQRIRFCFKTQYFLHYLHCHSGETPHCYSRCQAYRHGSRECDIFERGCSTWSQGRPQDASSVVIRQKRHGVDDEPACGSWKLTRGMSLTEFKTYSTAVHKNECRMFFAMFKQMRGQNPGLTGKLNTNTKAPTRFLSSRGLVGIEPTAHDIPAEQDQTRKLNKKTQSRSSYRATASCPCHRPELDRRECADLNLTYLDGAGLI